MNKFCSTAASFSISLVSGSALEQTHIFALAHILRRPIIVYGVKYVKSFRGETIDLAKFQGKYWLYMHCMVKLLNRYETKASHYQLK